MKKYVNTLGGKAQTMKIMFITGNGLQEYWTGASGSNSMLPQPMVTYKLELSAVIGLLYRVDLRQLEITNGVSLQTAPSPVPA